MKDSKAHGDGTTNLALVGRKLGHSYSKLWFDDLFGRLGLTGYSYSLKEMDSLDGLRQWVHDSKISGFNVTVPYKRAIIPLLDGYSGLAYEIDAVNCVLVGDDGRLTGHNTDAPAFRHTLEQWMSAAGVRFHKALILGTGGAARAVGYAMQLLDIPHLFVSRNPARFTSDDSAFQVIGYSELTAAVSRSAKPVLIVNATPVGMFPDVDSAPLDLRALNISIPNLFLYDLVYNPSQTLLMRQAEQCGARVKNGLEMLHMQARLSWDIWCTGKKIALDTSVL